MIPSGQPWSLLLCHGCILLVLLFAVLVTVEESASVSATDTVPGYQSPDMPRGSMLALYNTSLHMPTIVSMFPMGSGGHSSLCDTATFLLGEEAWNKIPPETVSTLP